MTETVYGLIKKNLIQKDKKGQRKFIDNPYQFKSGMFRFYATKADAQAKLNSFDVAWRDGYKIVKLETHFPDGYFVVNQNSDGVEGRGANIIVGRFTHLTDAMQVARNLGVMGVGDGSITFNYAEIDAVYNSVKAFEDAKTLPPVKNRTFTVRAEQQDFAVHNANFLLLLQTLFTFPVKVKKAKRPVYEGAGDRDGLIQVDPVFENNR